MRDEYAAWCKDNPDVEKLDKPLFIAEKIETPKKEVAASVVSSVYGS